MNEISIYSDAYTLTVKILLMKIIILLCTFGKKYVKLCRIDPTFLYMFNFPCASPKTISLLNL